MTPRGGILLTLVVKKITPDTSVLMTPGVFSCVEQNHDAEIELVRRARAGDRAAFDRLAGRYRAALRTMEHVATLLPGAQRDRVLEARERVKAGDRMDPARFGFLMRFATEMIAHGEEAGTLDSTLDRAAKVFGHELECRLMQSG